MKAVNPRHGTMQVWPRKRANKASPRVRSWASSKEPGLLGFAGFKAGMTRVQVTDAHKTSMTKGEELILPATIIECPPIKIYSVRAYTKKGHAHQILKEVVVGKDKHLFRKLLTKKAANAKELDNFLTDDTTNITVLILTQPSLVGIGRKKPDVLEMHLGGTNEEKLAFIKEHLTSGIKMSEVYKEGDYFDAHAVTTGKGYQGSVKRFGVSLKHHKSEKGVRRVGALGSWKSQQHWQYRIAYPGQMGYHQRVQYNNQILKISDNPEEVNPQGGLINYGVVKNEYMVVLGSIPGPKKRLISLIKPVRLHKKTPKTTPTVEQIITRSQQRR
jgi:large subunit ribosomal protein L3